MRDDNAQHLYIVMPSYCSDHRSNTFHPNHKIPTSRLDRVLNLSNITTNKFEDKKSER